jgi:3-oxoacyl-[acyl-carrier protein] reductase
VNQVMPGATATDRTKTILASKARAAGTTEAEEADKALRDIPLKRWAQPEEIASAIVFLLSPVSGFTTGATLQLDGGSTRSTL